jgi:hypothetical protein
MKATDFRIGNIVDMGREGVGMISGYNLYQKSIHDNGGAVADYYNEWKPITLTEDELIKLGFEFDSGYYKKEGKFFYPTICIMFETNTLLIEDMYNDNINIKKTEYVHQLQNLYFALTGEELQYKVTNKKI